MDYTSLITAVVVGIVTGGIGLEIVRGLLNRRSNAAKVVGEEADSYTKLQKLIEETLSKVARQNEELIQKDSLLAHNRQEIDGQKFVISYQKEERAQWMDMLATTLEGNSKRDLQIDELKKMLADHTREIQACAAREDQFKQTVSNLEGRLNIMVGILHKNNLELPEGFIWTQAVESQV